MMMILNEKCMQVNTRVENSVLVDMAGEAQAIDGAYWRDYWMGGLRTADGWKWRSGDPMDYTNWHEDNPDGLVGGPYTTLLKNIEHSTYRWAAETDPDTPDKVDNGVICEIRLV